MTNAEKKTRKEMKAIRSFLTDKGGGFIPSEWEMLLGVLEDNLLIYYDATEQIMGLTCYTVKTGRGEVMHPLFKIQQTAVVQIKSIADSFGLNLKAGSKLGATEVKKSESALDKFLKNQNNKEYR